MLRKIVIVGASLAGLRAAETLRREGFDGKIVLLGEEEDPPYDRPPLSKQILGGTWDIGRARLAADVHFDDLAIDLQTSSRAIGLDLYSKAVILGDERRIEFDGAIITTGARARRLSGSHLKGVHCLRTLSDCAAIRIRLEQSPRVTVIGAGFIGSEVVSTLRERGIDVTIVHLERFPMEAVLGRQLAEVLQAMHFDSGTTVHHTTAVTGFRGTDHVEGVVVADGTVIETDLVITGAGVEPNAEWVDGSGLQVRNGIVCDEFCAADTAARVYAAGDVARWPNGLTAREDRIEHWTNAVEQARQAAMNLLAGPNHQTPYRPLPYFWSDQFGVKIQVLGHVDTGSRFHVADGTVEERRFTAVFVQDAVITAAVAFNSPVELARLKPLVAERVHHGTESWR